MADSEKIRLIQDVAFSLFLENGYEATSIRQICKICSIEAPTLYYYFDSKKGLFFSIAKKLCDNYEFMNNENTILYKNMSAEQILYNVFMYSIKYSINNIRQTCFLIRYYLFPPKELKDEINTFLHEYNRKKEMYTKQAFKECIEKGLINLELEQASQIYWKFINSNTYDVVFYKWMPTTQELEELWAMFLKCRLKGTKFEL